MHEPSPQPVSVRPPSFGLLARELRVVGELSSFLLRAGKEPGLPRGDGHPVMVLPGFTFGDLGTRPLRRALTSLGYDAHGWGQGPNLGMPRRVRDGLFARVEALHAKHGRPVSLVGWSLGGVYAREVARGRPHLVRRVFTLGSPINHDPDANNVRVVGDLLRGRPSAPSDPTRFAARRPTPPVPCVAVYTKTDGVVAWPCCMEDEQPHTENVEVRGSHGGLVCSLEVLRVLAERLPLPGAMSATSSD